MEKQLEHNANIGFVYVFLVTIRVDLVWRSKNRLALAAFEDHTIENLFYFLRAPTP